MQFKVVSLNHKKALKMTGVFITDSGEMVKEYSIKVKGCQCVRDQAIIDFQTLIEESEPLLEFDLVKEEYNHKDNSAVLSYVVSFKK